MGGGRRSVPGVKDVDVDVDVLGEVCPLLLEVCCEEFGVLSFDFCSCCCCCFSVGADRVGVVVET